MLAQSREAKFETYLDDMLEIAGDAPLVIGGPPQRYTKDASIGPWTFAHYDFEIPPILAYQVSWHYGRRRGEPLRWIETPPAGSYCLQILPRDPAQRPPTLYDYHDTWVGHRVGLLHCGGAELSAAGRGAR